MSTLDFYFDFISPYAYLAALRLPALAAQCGATIRYKPILFAALLDAHGTLGPAEVPAKRRYVFLDVMRKAHLLGVPLVPPPSHPFNPLLGLRVVAAAPEAAREAVVGCLFQAAWGRGEGITEAEGVRQHLDAAGFDGASLVAAAHETPAKVAVKANTDGALAAGAFGVPTMCVEGDLFWGFDSLAALEARLRGEGPDVAEALARWEHLPASAVRAKASGAR